MKHTLLIMKMNYDYILRVLAYFKKLLALAKNNYREFRNNVITPIIVPSLKGFGYILISLVGVGIIGWVFS
jgi:hypothetical protein